MRKAEPKADSHGVLRLNTFLSSPSAIVLFIAVAKLLFHLFTANRYGIFRDELYYLACAEHLDWGYVDQPPLIAGKNVTSSMPAVAMSRFPTSNPAAGVRGKLSPAG